MKILIVSGHRGANWNPTTDASQRAALGWLQDLIFEGEWIQIWHGGATGVDEEANRIAAEAQIDTHVFRARWRKQGRSAGLLRNERMASAAARLREAGHDVHWAIMPGGPGTADARRRAVAREIPIYEPAAHPALVH